MFIYIYTFLYGSPSGGSRGDAAPLKIQCLVYQGTIRQVIRFF